MATISDQVLRRIVLAEAIMANIHMRVFQLNQSFAAAKKTGTNNGTLSLYDLDQLENSAEVLTGLATEMQHTLSLDGPSRQWGLIRSNYSNDSNNSSAPALKCASCLHANATDVCGGCFDVCYCSRECQTLHWLDGDHKSTCRSTATISAPL